MGRRTWPRLNEVATHLPGPRLCRGDVDRFGTALRTGPDRETVLAGVCGEPPELLRGGGRTSAGRSQHCSQNALVVVQVALALVLLVELGPDDPDVSKLTHGPACSRTLDDPRTPRISIAAEQVLEPERVTRMESDILERLAAVPGVTSAAFVTNLPMDRAMNAIAPVEGNTYGGGLPPLRTIKLISPGLFRTLGTPLVAGRDLTWVEIYEQRNVTLVSESLAREEWNSASAAIGKRMHVGISGPWQEVVAVADIYDDGATRSHRRSSIGQRACRSSMTAADRATFVAFTIRAAGRARKSFCSRYSAGRVGGQCRPAAVAGPLLRGG